MGTFSCRAASGTIRFGARGAFREQRIHFVIRGLSEVVVPLADSIEDLRRRHEGARISRLGQNIAGAHGHDRGRGHDDGRLMLPQGQNRGLHSGARRDAVIDQQDGSAAERREGAVAAVEPLAASELSLLHHRHLVEGSPVNAKTTHDFSVHYPNAAAGDRSHGEFRLPGHADLPNHEDVQRGAERLCDLVCDRNSATREAKNHQIRTPSEVGQSCRELSAGVPTIQEQVRHRSLLLKNPDTSGRISTPQTW